MKSLMNVMQIIDFCVSLIVLSCLFMVVMLLLNVLSVFVYAVRFVIVFNSFCYMSMSFHNFPELLSVFVPGLDFLGPAIVKTA